MKTALVNMPFGFHIYPSIQLGTLSSLLKSHGWESKSYYLNLHFASRIGFPAYKQLCEKRFLIGEWLFSHLLFGDGSKNKEYMNHYDSHIREVCHSLGCTEESLLDMKTRMIPEFLQWATDSIPWNEYKIVGFTSTFNQNIASVTLAKLIKEKYPEIKIIFGGANFDSEMGEEYFRVFPWIDFAVPGEAEAVLPTFMKAFNEGSSLPQGILQRGNGHNGGDCSSTNMVELAKSQPPDYDDYFEQLEQIDPQSSLLESPIILYETARGCWWGEKHHCTFCGLNAATMKFRSRSSEQVLEDIATLSQRYNAYRFRFVDNILERKHVEEVFGELANENYDMEFFIEVKSNLTKQQIKTLAQGGAKTIQPGIESFSVNQLKEMDKGVSPIRNILCLKWACYYGIEMTWSILTGFPKETDEDYRNQIDLIKRLTHLTPPIDVGDIWLERFSPYFTRPGDYGIKISGPGEAYGFVYDSPEIDLMKIAYDFEYETENKINPGLVQELRETVHEWKSRHQSEDLPYLIYMRSMDFVTVFDTRSASNPTKTRYDIPGAWIISYCGESLRTPVQIRDHVNEKSAGEISDGTINEAIRELESKQVLYQENGKYLTLALPHNSQL
jgi:ribosomal peptide maturation radical SAM protein 1